MNEVLKSVFDDSLFLETYQQAQKITWEGRPSYYAKRPPRVWWRSQYYIPSFPDRDIDCWAHRLIEYHHLEELAKKYQIGQKPEFNRKPKKFNRHSRKIYSRRLLRYFMMLSRQINKEIDLYSQNDIDDFRLAFELRVNPTMTWKSRIRQMKDLAMTSGNILRKDSNVREIYFGGSLQKGSQYPGDVDLLVVTQGQLTLTPGKYNLFGKPLSIVPFTTWHGGEDNPLKFLHSNTIFELDKEAEKAAYRVDCCVVSQEMIQNISCCSRHADIIREFKAGIELN